MPVSIFNNNDRLLINKAEALSLRYDLALISEISGWVITCCTVLKDALLDDFAPRAT